MPFTREDVISHLEGCYHDPYRWFVDLEHPYSYNATAGLHLYGDPERWAMVFETTTFGQRAMRIELKVSSFGNCLSNLAIAANRYTSNTDLHTLVIQAELVRVLRGQELVPLPVGPVTVREQQVMGPETPAELVARGIRGNSGVEIAGLMRLADRAAEGVTGAGAFLRGVESPREPRDLGAEAKHLL